MKPPRFPKGDTDRNLELEVSLEPMLDVMLTVAVSAGYSEAEALTAIASLVNHRHLANAENFVTEAMIKDAAKHGKLD